MTWTRPAPSEVALAAGTTVAMAVDVHEAAHPWVGLAALVVAGASLAWRLGSPWLPLLLCGGVNVWLLATAPGQFGPQTAVFGLIVATYSAAAHLTGRSAAAAGLVSLALFWTAHASTVDGDVADFWPGLEWGVPWLAGRLVRRQTLQARAAGARAARAELETQEAVVQERDRIARELHDVVAHAVSLMVVLAGAERLAGDLSPRTRDVLQSIETSGRQALVELRTMLGVLRESDEADREPQPDLLGVPQLVESVRAAGLDVRLSMPPAPDVPQGVGLAAYRVVQEALTNALRHGAGSADVTIEVDDEVRVDVRNPLGRRSAEGTGRGLVGMRERVGLFAGQVEAGPRGDEWVLCVRLPLDRGRAA